MDSEENTLSVSAESNNTMSTSGPNNTLSSADSTSTQAASTESTLSVEAPNNSSSPVINLTNETKTESKNNANSMAKSPAAKGRTSEQKKGDEGSAEVLKRMQNLYETEFANVPANKRPKAKAWAARAAYYKPTEEAREEYIQKMIQNDRNSLTSKASGNLVASSNNNSESLVNQLIAALDTANRVARQLKNSTRKNGKRSANFSTANMNFAENSSMGENMNSYNNSLSQPKRVSTLPMKKTKKAKKNGNMNMNMNMNMNASANTDPLYTEF
jgi:hypothetical protein